MLLLDEITVDMDVVGRLDLLAFFTQECEERGATIIYVRRHGVAGWHCRPGLAWPGMAWHGIRASLWCWVRTQLESEGVVAWRILCMAGEQGNHLVVAFAALPVPTACLAGHPHFRWAGELAHALCLFGRRQGGARWVRVWGSAGASLALLPVRVGRGTDRFGSPILMHPGASWRRIPALWLPLQVALSAASPSSTRAASCCMSLRDG